MWLYITVFGVDQVHPSDAVHGSHLRPGSESIKAEIA